MKNSSVVDLLLLLLLAITVLTTPAFSDLVLSKVERRIDVTSQIARVTKTLKVVNSGSESVSEFTLTFPKFLGNNLAYLTVSHSEGKGKAKRSLANLSVEEANPKGMPDSVSFYTVALPKPLSKGDTLTLEVVAAFTNVLQPFPEKISQRDIHLVMLQESAQYLSPYAVESQSLSVKLPHNARIESYTKLENTKVQGSEIKYGPYKNLAQYSYAPIVVHFESKAAFAVAEKLVREIEVSHWGNVQVTEHYNLVHRGAQLKGEFSRLEYQDRPNPQGVSAFRHLLARLPPRAHSIYYRDDIGNISTSQMKSDSKKTEVLIEPRFPLFGGWKTFFTIGYGLPLSDFLFASEGKRFLDISFGSPMLDLVTEKLIVQVVLPEGSKDISVTTPFAVKQSHEIKYSHLDIAGRPVVVLEKNNVVPDHNQNIQVYYKFSNINLLSEPLMLITGFFVLFITCIIYTRADFSISKSSAAYLAKLQWDEVLATVQEVQNIIQKCLAAHDKLEASLRDLSRTGDIQTCKAARKSTDSSLKDLSKELRPLLASLQSFPSASQISPKVEELVAKERELQEKLMAKHTTVVEGYEKKSSGRDIENRIASQQQKIIALRQEVEDLLEFIDEI
ncbi:Dolichyl-diphosphooligosaccharide--protein glycosyltransferase subunit 1A [Raphanus sativus]|uniref:Dolichyl-diphosphooligosaccharide--protein glycosyltransferase subunit 1 n=1 Tax=Raphanus sativus TaxID=3726 RepID=A0A6J0KDC8_RAPSA|nr:dolichyl-diphosphooligosaccharide--protein glycosyltransferase subunit 1A [Raphanus sativus]KAJ4883919.1 Dolichyl-diphosphooligosaccharide--protein glycosyltransferase subunit 1A [Raphanus sativus]